MVIFRTWFIHTRLLPCIYFNGTAKMWFVEHGKHRRPCIDRSENGMKMERQRKKKRISTRNVIIKFAHELPNYADEIKSFTHWLTSDECARNHLTGHKSFFRVRIRSTFFFFFFFASFLWSPAIALPFSMQTAIDCDDNNSPGHLLNSIGQFHSMFV